MKCPICKLVNPPEAERCDCGYNFVLCRPEPQVETKERISSARVIHDQPGDESETRSNIRYCGASLIFLGLLIAAFFVIGYDTSVAGTDGTTRINNMGLMQNRQSGISGGLQLSILGALLMIYSKER